MKQMQIPSRQRGFTLVEIAIVLVIIGLLLGGVLKGQEMIENARIKSVITDMNGVATAYNSYVDRYRAIPGDELAATMNARGWTGTVGGNASGVLNVTPAQTLNNTGEQTAMWRALRGAGLAGGDPAAPATAAGLPRAGRRPPGHAPRMPAGWPPQHASPAASPTARARRHQRLIQVRPARRFCPCRA